MKKDRGIIITNKDEVKLAKRIVNCQREQLVCDRCNGSGLEPNNKTLYYKPCQKCS